MRRMKWEASVSELNEVEAFGGELELKRRDDKRRTFRMQCVFNKVARENTPRNINAFLVYLLYFDFILTTLLHFHISLASKKQ